MSGSYIGSSSPNDVVPAVEDYTIVANVNYVASTYVAVRVSLSIIEMNRIESNRIE